MTYPTLNPDYVPYHPQTIRNGLLAAIAYFEPDLIVGEECELQDLLECLVDVTDVDHVDAAEGLNAARAAARLKR